MRPVVAPLPGVIHTIFIEPRAQVAKGQILLELESFGMLQKISSPLTGVVRLLLVTHGEQVSRGATLLELDQS